VAPNLHGRSFLKAFDFSPREWTQLLDRAASLKAAKYAGTERQLLRGRNLAFILTDVPHVERGFGTPSATPILRVTRAALRRETFAAGSMGPKVDAVCRSSSSPAHARAPAAGVREAAYPHP